MNNEEFHTGVQIDLGTLNWKSSNLITPEINSMIKYLMGNFTFESKQLGQSIFKRDGNDEYGILPLQLATLNFDNISFGSDFKKKCKYFSIQFVKQEEYGSLICSTKLKFILYFLSEIESEEKSLDEVKEEIYDLAHPAILNTELILYLMENVTVEHDEFTTKGDATSVEKLKEQFVKRKAKSARSVITK